MNDDQDFKRNARLWLDMGPNHVPTRIVDATLRKIAITPQQRTFRTPRRQQFMPTQPRLALAAVVAVLVLALGGGYLLLRYGQSQVAVPGPTSSPAVSASPTHSALPAGALDSRWDSVGVRAAPEGQQPFQQFMFVDATSVRINTFKGEIVSSLSFSGDNDRLVVKLQTAQPSLTLQHWDCLTGDEGTYGFGLSANGKTLTLSPVNDACGVRSTILAGDWTRWPCPNPQSVCGAELSPGSHVETFQPNIDPNSRGTPPPTALNAFTYTVPAGWSELRNGLGRPNDPGTMGISLTLDVAAHSQASDCPDAVAPGVGSTAGALAPWLVALPGLVTTTPQPITIGGYAGQMLDLSVAPEWTLPCQQFFQAPERVVFTFADPVPPPGGGVYIRDLLDQNAHARYILLDVGPGHNLLIEVDAPDQSSFRDLVQAAMPIIESFQFTPEIH